MSRGCAWLLFVVSAAVLFLAVSSSASAEEPAIEDGFSPTPLACWPSPVHVGTGPGNDTASIHDAVDQSCVGGTVLVHAGTYYENVIINKALTLEGEDRETAIINGSGTGTVIHITADDVILKNITAEYGSPSPFEYGIYLDFASNVLIENVCSNNSGNGIRFFVSPENIIMNSIFSNNAYVGIYLYSPDNLLINNIVSHNGHFGIKIGSSGNSLFNNTVSHNSDDGIHVTSSGNSIVNNTVINNRHGCALSSSDDNLIVNNTVSDNSLDGINLAYSRNNTLIGNTISFNSYNGLDISYSYDNNISNNLVSHNSDNGIFLGYSYNNSISGDIARNNTESGIYLTFSYNNSIMRNTASYNIEDGIHLLFSHNNSINGNSVSDNVYGIFLWAISDFKTLTSNNKITGNTVWNNLWGIRSDNASYNIIYNNNLIDNSIQAHDDSTNSWDLSYPYGGNYWSDYGGVDFFSGPNQDIPGPDGIGDTPYDIPGGTNQDMYPLMEPLNAIPVHNHARGTHYTTIQDAIDDAEANGWAGDTIDIDPGVYNESVYIDFPIELVGALRDAVVVNGTGTGSAITVENTNGVTLRNLTIRNSLTTTGITLHNVQASTIEDVAVNLAQTGIRLLNVSQTTLSDVAVTNTAYSLDGDNLDDIFILNSSFLYSVDGISLFNASNAHLSFLDISVSVRGIYLWDVSHSTVEQVSVTGSLYAIYITNTDNTTVFDSTLSDNSYGIYALNAYNNHIHHNRIISNSVGGVGLYGSDFNTVERNFIVGNQNGFDLSNSNNNTLSWNHVYGSTYIGAQLTSCLDNLIHHNNFISNYLHDSDDGSNLWDDGQFGNHWDTWTAPDADENGIVDSFYPILSGPNDDNFPLVEPLDILGPDIYNFTHEGMFVLRNGTLWLYINASDDNHPEDAFTPSVEYKSPTGAWTPAPGPGVYVGSAPDGYWMYPFAPVLSAELGEYDLRGMFTDPDGNTSLWLYDSVFVQNNLPIIGSMQDPAPVPEDDEIVLSLAKNKSDAEDGPSLLYWQLGYFDPLAIEGFLGDGAQNDTLRIVPVEDFFGETVVELVLRDADGGYDVVSLTLNWTAVNDAPDYSAIPQGLGVFEDSKNLTVLDLRSHFADVDNLSLSFSLVSNSQEGLVSAYIHSLHILALDAMTGTANDNWFGEFVLVIRAFDGLDYKDSLPVTFSVFAINDAPYTTTQVAPVDIDEDETHLGLNLTDLFFDVDNVTLAFSAKDAGGVHVEIDPYGAATIIPQADWHGSANVTLFASDGLSPPAEMTVWVRVKSVSDAPSVLMEIPNKHITEDVPQNWLIYIPSYFTDADGDGLTYRINLFSNVSKLDLQIEGGYLNVIGLAANWTGDVIATVTVSDGIYNTSSNPFRITTDPVNDGPAWNPVPDIHIPEDSGEFTSFLLDTFAMDAEIASSKLDYSVAYHSNALFSVQIDPSHRLLISVLEENYVGSTLVAVRASDGTLTTDAMFHIFIDSVNDFPSAAITSPLAGFESVTGALVTFSGDAYDADVGDSLEFFWDFGDGTTGRGAEPAHIYTLPGNFTVTLEVLDSADAQATHTTLVRILLDTDGDGISNRDDSDDDNDLHLDLSDLFPTDPTEWLDTDGDGVGDNLDQDDDGDGVPDLSDHYPLDGTKSKPPSQELRELLMIFFAVLAAIIVSAFILFLEMRKRRKKDEPETFASLPPEVAYGPYGSSVVEVSEMPMIIDIPALPPRSIDDIEPVPKDYGYSAESGQDTSYHGQPASSEVITCQTCGSDFPLFVSGQSVIISCPHCGAKGRLGPEPEDELF